MNLDVALRTISPFLIIMGLGYVSRMLGFLGEGDGRVLNSFIYYFALPSFLVGSLSQVDFIGLGFGFIIACLAPVLIAITVLYLFCLLFNFSMETFALLVVCTVFGNLFFYGMPFVLFGFSEAGSLATVSASFISLLTIPVAIIVLEIYGSRARGEPKDFGKIVRGLLGNPVIVSVFFGTFLSLLKVPVPVFVLNSLNLLGSTTVPLAIFLLGVFFYGRRYFGLADGFMLSLLRMVFLPTLALAIAKFVSLGGMEETIVVIMHATPLATPMIVFSERYNFFKDTIASLLLISSVLGGVYLNLWLLVLGH
ncbi:MAG: AEC family transporter [Nitrososphaeria archaeon]|nr:AEC family transporter [Nitrososphaeria archaeon]